MASSSGTGNKPHPQESWTPNKFNAGPSNSNDDDCKQVSATRSSLDDEDEPDSPPRHRITLDPGADETSSSPASPSHDTEPITTPSGEVLPAVIIPPYWQTHTRTISSVSALSQNGKPAPIRMEDNTVTEEESLGLKSPLWARVVVIDSYVVVSGGSSSGLQFGMRMGSGAGDYVVWSCRVRMIDGGEVHLHKRYSEFEGLRRELASSFPRAGGSLPVLPAKSVLYRFRPAFLEKRRAGLEYFLNCVLLNPEFASSVVLKDFVFT